MAYQDDKNKKKNVDAKNNDVLKYYNDKEAKPVKMPELNLFESPVKPVKMPEPNIKRTGNPVRMPEPKIKIKSGNF